jgi:hypothetical protein
MQMIRGHDRDDINPILSCRFYLRHLVKIGIAAIRLQMQQRPGALTVLPIGGESPSDQLKLIIHPRRQPMYRADKRTFTATYHSQL